MLEELPESENGAPESAEGFSMKDLAAQSSLNDDGHKRPHQLTHLARRDDTVHPVWTVSILLWMSVGLGTYFFKMLTSPGRLERIAKLLQSLLN